MATYSKLNTGKPTGADFADIKDITDRIDNNEAALAGDSSLNNIDITGGSIANVSAVITAGSIAGVTAAVTSLSCSGNASVAGNSSVTGNSTINGTQTVTGVATNDGNVINNGFVNCIKGIAYSDPLIGSSLYIVQEKIDIGAWNMVADASVSLDIPSSVQLSRIYAVNIIIYNDTGKYITGICPTSTSVTSTTSSIGFSIDTSTGRIYIRRLSGSMYDGIDFDNTSVNRGYVLITHSYL